MAWSTPDEIKKRWIASKVLPPDNTLITFIDDVEGQVRRAFPTVQARIDSTELPLRDVQAKIANIIIEFLMTEGTPYQQETQSYAGVGSRQVIVSGSARKSLDLTAADLAFFEPYVNEAFTAVTIQTSLSDYVAGSDYLSRYYPWNR